MLSRRRFLAVTVASAGSLWAGAGCGKDDDGSPNTDAGGDTHGDGGGGGDGGPDSRGDAADATADADVPVEEGTDYFPQSVASGDPRPDSIILWTRALVSARESEAIEVRLQVATSAAFDRLVSLDGAASLLLLADPEWDHCVKARITGLAPATEYYYRFLVRVDGVDRSSRVGRTRTAPAPDADVPVRFAFVSCQDFIGRYYNTVRLLAEQPIDFFVHLGDYIYETTGDRTFQSGEGRQVTFRDPGSAIVFHEGTEEEYFAARSLSNYRDLYRTYRSDAELQALHERAPMLAIWDDHEFSDDCWGANATYSDGREDELDVERRKNANRAWYEYMPVDYAESPGFVYDPEVAFPGDLRIYRDFRFGRHLHLVLTDLRTWRSDHVVPENALPGAIALDQAALETDLGGVPDFAVPYVEIGTFRGGSYQMALRAAAPELGYLPDQIVGAVSAPWVNRMVARILEADPEAELTPIGEEEMAGMERGIAFHSMGKSSPTSSLGSRSLVVEQAYLPYAAKRWAESGGESEQAMGEGQEAWFLETMRNSTATWKAWGNEFCLVPLRVDVSGFGALPDEFRQRFLLSAEDWSGMGNRRSVLLSELAAAGNVVAITGDIHAFFAGTPHADGDRDARIPEFVTSSLSSATYRTMLVRTANSDPALREAGAAAMAYAITDLLLSQDPPTNPHLAYADPGSNGFALVTAGAERFEVEYLALPESEVSELLSDRGESLAAKFARQRFRVESGSPDLLGEFDGTWKRWDMATLSWL